LQQGASLGPSNAPHRAYSAPSSAQLWDRSLPLAGWCDRVAEQLSDKYNSACREIRALSLSHSTSEKMAKLLLDWSARNSEVGTADTRLRLTLTHEEIGQRIGTSRETVTRLLTVWKKQRIVESNGPILLIRKMAALKAMAVGS
jgi:CRP/FNR family transcriptional regulator, cyclic AMP receptor protein